MRKRNGKIAAVIDGLMLYFCVVEHIITIYLYLSLFTVCMVQKATRSSISSCSPIRTQCASFHCSSFYSIRLYQRGKHYSKLFILSILVFIILILHDRQLFSKVKLLIFISVVTDTNSTKQNAKYIFRTDRKSSPFAIRTTVFDAVVSSCSVFFCSIWI